MLPLYIPFDYKNVLGSDRNKDGKMTKQRYSHAN